MPPLLAPACRCLGGPLTFEPDAGSCWRCGHLLSPIARRRDLEPWEQLADAVMRAGARERARAARQGVDLDDVAVYRAWVEARLLEVGLEPADEVAVALL